jgi:hypothetical protein
MSELLLYTVAATNNPNWIPIGKYQQIKNEYTDYYPDPMPETGRWLRVDKNYFK